MNIVLLNTRPLSWNKEYAGVHWSVRKKHADYYHELILATKNKFKNEISNLSFPVNIIITAFMDKPLIDPDNLNTKVIIDGLKNWCLPNDNYKYVDSVTSKVRKIKGKPYIQIEIL